MMIIEESNVLTKILYPNKEIFIIGTAHVSEQSINEVTNLIRKEKPELVCVELDQQRLNSIIKKEEWSNIDIEKVLRSGNGFLFLSNIILASMQKKMSIGINPGDELIGAIKVSDEEKIPYSLIDRNVNITMKRIWNNSSFIEKLKIVWLLFSSLFEKKSETFEIEQIKTKSNIQDMVDNLSKSLPTIKRILIDERDQFMAQSIYKTEHKKIVVVIGLAHKKGIVNHLESIYKNQEEINVKQLNFIPPKKPYFKIVSWAIPLIIGSFFLLGIKNMGWDYGLKLFTYWVLINGVCSSIGAILSMAHPLVVIMAFIFSPITSLNPMIGIGIFTGLLQYKLMKPKVLDFENFKADINSIKGLYRNRISRTLIVFFLTSICSGVATFIGLTVISSLV